MPRFAKSMERLGTETAFEVLARPSKLEAQGKDVVHLEIGEPTSNTPTNIIEAAKQALDQGFTHYGRRPGCPSSARSSPTLSPGIGAFTQGANVVVTPGPSDHVLHHAGGARPRRVRCCTQSRVSGSTSR